MNTKEFYDLLCDRGANVYAYSGRAMFGRQCIGITIGYNPYAFMAECVACLETDEDREDIIRIFSYTKTDSLGLGSIIYWPNMEWDVENMKEYAEDYE
jgi:hypothetical protein